jgi:hypothetical protein
MLPGGLVDSLRARLCVEGSLGSRLGGGGRRLLRVNIFTAERYSPHWKKFCTLCEPNACVRIEAFLDTALVTSVECCLVCSLGKVPGVGGVGRGGEVVAVGYFTLREIVCVNTGFDCCSW